jgi:hypothetical protein
MYVGAHLPLDLVGGAGLGMMIAAAVRRLGEDVAENLGVWAAVWIAVGIGQIGTASLLVGREPAGRLLAIIFAAGSIVVSFFTMGAYPFWHLTVIALDILIIYGLTTHPEAFEESEGGEGELEPDWMHRVDRPSTPPPLPR